MDFHRSHGARDPLFAVRIAEDCFHCGRSSRREGGNGRPRAAQTEADHVRMPHRQQPAQARHQPLPVWLMHSIPQRFAKIGGASRLQRAEEQRDVLHVEHRVTERHLPRQRTA